MNCGRGTWKEAVHAVCTHRLEGQRETEKIFQSRLWMYELVFEPRTSQIRSSGTESLTALVGTGSQAVHRDSCVKVTRGSGRAVLSNAPWHPDERCFF
jgi:hypothetical protein